MMIKRGLIRDGDIERTSKEGISFSHTADFEELWSYQQNPFSLERVLISYLCALRLPADFL